MKVSHRINVAGGDLPEDFSIKLDVAFSYTGCPIEELVKRVTSGQSDRVRVQAMLRKKTTAELTRLGLEGLTIKWDQIGVASVSANPVDILMAMSLGKFVMTVVKDLGISEDNALEIYARKHSIELEEVVEEYTTEKNEED